MAKRKISADINRPLSVTVTGLGGGGGGGGGAGTLPGTITPTTDNTITGSRHTHRMLPTHAALPDIGPADHHSPVTVGNTGLSIAGQQVSLRLATVSGLEVSSGLRLADSIAGNGLSIANKVLSVGVSGLGLSVGADAVTLTSSSNPGAAASILASDASGYLQLTRIGLNRAPLYPLHVAGATQQVRVDYNDSNYLSLTVGSDGAATLATVGASGNLNLNPGGDVVFDPTGNDLLPATGYDLNLGSLQRKYLTLHAAELWVETLVAQNTIATIGGRILVGPTTKLTRDVSDSTTLIDVEHNSLAYGDVVYLEANGKVEFLRIRAATITDASAAGDWVKVSGDWTNNFAVGHYITIAGSTGNNGEWVIASVTYDGGADKTQIAVTSDITSSVGDGYILYRGQQGVGPYRYAVTRNYDGSGSNEWYAGDALFNTGRAGSGFIDLYSVRGVKSGYGPTIVGNVRNSGAVTDWSEHWAIGNLNGVYGYGTDTYGAAFGRYANNSAFLTADATNGIRILKRAADANTVLAQWTMDGAITIGEVAPGQGNVQISAGAIALRVNTTETIKLYSTGAAVFGQVATGKGNMYWNPSNNRLEFRGSTNGTVVQAYVDTDGSIVAGGGNVKIDVSGIGIGALDTLAPTGALNWYSGGSLFAHVSAQRIPIGMEVYRYLTLALEGDGYPSIRLYQKSGGLPAPTRVDVTAGVLDLSHALNVGTNATVEGDLTVSGGLNLGTATGAGAGQLYLAGSSNQVVARLYHNNDDGVSLRLRVDDANEFASIYAYDENDGGTAGYVPLYLGHANNAANSLIVNGATGRVLIGTSTDDGVNKLQVNGSIMALTGWITGPRLVLPAVPAPSTSAGNAQLFLDNSDTKLKVRMPDGSLKTVQLV